MMQRKHLWNGKEHSHRKQNTQSAPTKESESTHIWNLRAAHNDCSGMSWIDPKDHTPVIGEKLGRQSTPPGGYGWDYRMRVFMVAIFARSVFPGQAWNSDSLGAPESPRRSKPLPSPPNAGNSHLTPVETAITLLLIYCYTTWNLIQMIIIHFLILSDSSKAQQKGQYYHCSPLKEQESLHGLELQLFSSRKMFFSSIL